MFFTIMQKLSVWKNLVLRLRTKMLSTNQIAGFFEHQYI